MGKKLLLAGVAAAALTLAMNSAGAADIETPEPVSDSSGFYVSLFGGASFLEDVDATQHYDTGLSDYDYSLNTKTGYIVGGAIGMRVWDPLRAEVELSYARWKADDYTFDAASSGGGEADGHVSATYLLANLWFDVNTDTAFTPYLGGGAGVGWATADTIFADDDRYGYGDGELGFAFQLGAGLKFGLAENIALDVGYRFKGILDVDFDARGKSVDIVSYEGGDLYSHNVQAGITFGF
jgi:opacity protein-like surface antigen